MIKLPIITNHCDDPTLLFGNRYWIIMKQQDQYGYLEIRETHKTLPCGKEDKHQSLLGTMSLYVASIKEENDENTLAYFPAIWTANSARLRSSNIGICYSALLYRLSIFYDEEIALEYNGKQLCISLPHAHKENTRYIFAAMAMSHPNLLKLIKETASNHNLFDIAKEFLIFDRRIINKTR